MGFKKIIFLIVASIPFICVSQKCPLLEKNTMLKQRSYFVLDSILQFNLNNILPNINYQDTSLVKDIIEKGKKYEDYMTFFKNQGVAVARISLEQFNALRIDTSLTARDRRILRQEEKNYQQFQNIDSLNSEKAIIALNKKLDRRKFKKLHNKLDSRKPVLFKMYPMYGYKNKILFMYLIYFDKRDTFLYEICEREE